MSLILGILLMTGCGAPSPDQGYEILDSETSGVDAPGGETIRDLLPCFYQAAGPEGEMASHDACAHLDAAGRLTVEPSHLEVMDFGEGLRGIEGPEGDALASLFVDGSWFYARRDGQTLGILTYDNGPDPWQDGLARGLREGRMVYFDRSFESVIDLELDWGWPFEDGLALVCRGCRLEGHGGDEHRALVGGQWGYLNRDGTVRVPITGTREQANAALRAPVP